MIQDFANSPVPDARTVTGWQIGLIFIGVGLTLPAFLAGAMIGNERGFVQGVLATLIAGAILAVSAGFTAWIGGRGRVSTYIITHMTFGQYGALFINLLLAAMMFGWFGVTIGMFAQAMDGILPFPWASQKIWCVIGGGLMTLTAAYGFNGLRNLSVLAVPIMLGALILMSVFSLTSLDHTQLFKYQGTQNISFGGVVSLLVGSWMVGVAIFPDISRYARTPGHGVLGGFLCFLPGLAAIMIFTFIPAILFGERDFVQLMQVILTPFFAALVIVLASWSTNDNNLYGSSLSLASLIPSLPKWGITIFAGTIGTLLGATGITENFISFLIILSILIPPVAGSYIADYFFNTHYYYDDHIKIIRKSSLTAWASGALVAYMTTPQDALGWGILNLSTIPALDGMIAAALIIALFACLDKYVPALVERYKTKKYGKPMPPLQ